MKKISPKIFEHARVTRQVMRIYVIVMMLGVCQIMTVMMKAHLQGNEQPETERREPRLLCARTVHSNLLNIVRVRSGVNPSVRYKAGSNP